MDSSDEAVSIVVDNGSHTIKSGWSGEEEPETLTRSLVARSHADTFRQTFLLGRQPAAGLDSAVRQLSLCSVGEIFKRLGEQRPFYLGASALAQDGMLGAAARSPLKEGVVTDWDGMELLWQRVFADAGEFDGITMNSCCGSNAYADKETITELMFERFAAQRFYLASSATLAMYASGRNCGVVIDIGFEKSTVTPFFDGYSVTSAVAQSTVAGRQVTNCLTEILEYERGIRCAGTAAQQELLDESIKHQHCRVALHFDKELDQFEAKDVEYEMPDGTLVPDGDWAIRAPEVLFDPYGSAHQVHERTVQHLGQQLHKKGPRTAKRELSVQQLVHKSLFQHLDVEDPYVPHVELLSNMVLVGHGSLYPMLAERLASEISRLVPPLVLQQAEAATNPHRGSYSGPLRVYAAPTRHINTWIGGSIKASLSTFHHVSITSKQFSEAGSRIVHQMCHD